MTWWLLAPPFYSVIPAKAGIQFFTAVDSRLRGNDVVVERGNDVVVERGNDVVVLRAGGVKLTCYSSVCSAIALTDPAPSPISPPRYPLQNHPPGANAEWRATLHYPNRRHQSSRR